MFKKINEPYDAPVFTMNENQYNQLIRHSTNEIVYTSRDFVRKIDAEILLEQEKESYWVTMDKDRVPTFNMMVTKNIFERISKQKEFTKINLVFYNVFSDYEETLTEVNSAYEISLQTAKNNLKKMKDVTAIGGDLGKPVGNTAIAVAKKMDIFEAIKGDVLKTKLILGENAPINKENIDEISASVALAVSVAEGKTLQDFLKLSDIAFTRIEVDFVKEEVNIFKCYSDLLGANPRNFQPWKYNLHEEYDETWSFSELKKNSFERIQIDEAAEIVEEIETLAHPLNKSKEALDEVFGECYIGYRNSEYGHKVAKKYSESKLMLVLSYILQYNIIEKEVEKKRVLKPNNNNNKKKKNKQNNYKSIVIERYVYKEDKMLEIENQQKEILREENEKIERERAESKYVTPEWEVKPHTRRLKDGRVILVEGQKRKRRKELSDIEETEKAKRTFKTLGITKKDMEKLKNNATEK